jgi:hypothetical protein
MKSFLLILADLAKLPAVWCSFARLVFRENFNDFFMAGTKKTNEYLWPGIKEIEPLKAAIAQTIGIKLRYLIHDKTTRLKEK